MSHKHNVSDHHESVAYSFSGEAPLTYRDVKGA